MSTCPYYLTSFEKEWKRDPVAANLAWFKNAGFGMFIHFSPGSALPIPMEFANIDPLYKKTHSRNAELNDDEYLKYLNNTFFNDDIQDPVREIVEAFRPDKFDAEAIADLAVEAGMKYITFTTRHICGRMFMHKTDVSPWNSKRLLDRDFVAELTAAAQKRDLGFFFYMMAPYDAVADRIKAHLANLLTNYGAITGVWFDGIWQAYRRPKAFVRPAEIFAHVRSIQPHCLISFKTGYTGDEDFLAPEVHQIRYDDDGVPELPKGLPSHCHEERTILRLKDAGTEEVQQSVSDVWHNELRHKPVESCVTMIKGNKWFDTEGGEHLNADEVVEKYRYLQAHKANLLLNIGPRGDGSVHPDDVKSLKAAGEIIRSEK